jgi:hypothetical protein
MSLWFSAQNVDVPVYVAMAWYNPSCQDSWTKWGWYELPPNGQAVLAVEGNLNYGNEYYGLYAVAPNGSVWSGRIWNKVKYDVFNQCIFDDKTDNVPMGFIEFDILNVEFESGDALVIFAEPYWDWENIRGPGIPPGIGWQAYLPD